MKRAEILQLRDKNPWRYVFEIGVLRWGVSSGVLAWLLVAYQNPSLRTLSAFAVFVICSMIGGIAFGWITWFIHPSLMPKKRSEHGPDRS